MNERLAPASDVVTRLGPGRLVLVVGPSGAGKDTLLNIARCECADSALITFPRRVVTRRASQFEENDELETAAFRQAIEQDTFAVYWEAHGHCYGLRRSIDDDVRAGRTVVANVSRRVVAVFRRLYAHVAVVEVTAPAEVLAARLSQRHRVSDGDLGARMGRAGSDDPLVADITIVNIGDPRPHAATLVKIIKGERVADEAQAERSIADVEDQHD